MAVRQLIYAPDPIFKKTSEAVAEVTDETRALIADLHDTLQFEEGVGMAAPMIGVLERVIVANLLPDGKSEPLTFINPEVTWESEEMQTVDEASLCFPGIGAPITRPKAIKLSYIDEQGTKQTFEAEDFLSSVIQHEIDYLDGKTYLDYLSKMKRDMLLKKMQKIMKHTPPHVHNAHCNH